MDEKTMVSDALVGINGGECETFSVNNVLEGLLW